MRCAARIAVALLVCADLAGCGYRLVRYSLPPPAGGCVRFEGLGGGGAWPRTAPWTSSALEHEIAPDLCADGDSVLLGTVDAVEPVGGHHAVSSGGTTLLGGRWMARGSIRIESGGRVVWGPVGAEVERDFISTGDPLLEQDAFDTHLKLLARDLGVALARVLYGEPL